MTTLDNTSERAIIIRGDVPLPYEAKYQRGSMYPFADLTPGQAFFVPTTEDGVPRLKKNLKILAGRQTKKLGKSFEVRRITLDGKPQVYVGVWVVEPEAA